MTHPGFSRSAAPWRVVSPTALGLTDGVLFVTSEASCRCCCCPSRYCRLSALRHAHMKGRRTVRPAPFRARCSRAELLTTLVTGIGFAVAVGRLGSIAGPALGGIPFKSQGSFAFILAAITPFVFIGPFCLPPSLRVGRNIVKRDDLCSFSCQGITKRGTVLWGVRCPFSAICKSTGRAACAR